MLQIGVHLRVLTALHFLSRKAEKNKAGKAFISGDGRTFR
jgi:hypothetical protein